MVVEFINTSDSISLTDDSVVDIVPHSWIVTQTTSDGVSLTDDSRGGHSPSLLGYYQNPDILATLQKHEEGTDSGDDP